VGQKQGLVVTIPSASGTGLGTPTGVIGNTTASSFVVSITQGGVTKSGKAAFLFATQDSTIGGWNPAVPPTTAVIAANRSNCSGPPNFGPFSNAVLVANNIKDGEITPSIQPLENSSDTSPMETAGRS
jgi:hypothetical protein